VESGVSQRNPEPLISTCRKAAGVTGPNSFSYAARS
jgi:hypothetical protein